MTRSRDLWIAAFLVAVFAPIVLRVASFERQGFWQELVTVTGLLTASLLVCTVVLTARLRSITRAFGIEAVLASHRVLGVGMAVAALAHVAAVVVADPRNVAFLALLQPSQTSGPLLNIVLDPAPLRAIAGVVALACLVVLVLAAAWRRGRYEVWRGWHIALWMGLWIATAAHVVLIDHLVPATGLLAWLRWDPAAGVVLAGDLSWDPLGAGFLGMLAAVLVAVTVRRWLILPFQRQGRYRVAGVHALSPTVSTLVLRPDGWARATLAFRPGEFAWLRLARDPFAQEHPFTISSAAQAGSTIEFTIRHSGDWTNGPLRRLQAGDHVWLDAPHGALTPTTSTSGLVLVAGGVGIAPMMSILRTAARGGDRRPVRLLLADRPGEGLFRQELEQLRRDLELEIHDLGRGPLTAELFAALLPPQFVRDRLEYFVCGPPSLVRDAIASLGALDVPAKQVHSEQFHS